jgi:phosphatidate cytidylyltransferase
VRTRILTILVLAPPFLYCVFRGGLWLALPLVVLAAVALREVHLLHRVAPPDPVEVGLAGLVGLAGVAGPGALLAALALGVTRMALPLGFPPVATERVRRAAASLSGLVLYSLPFGAFLLLRQGPQGLAVVASLLTLIWAQDSGAYLCGRAFGRHKLSPEISPKKTWEGTYGGFLLALPLAQWVFMRLGGTWVAVGLPYEWIGWGMLGGAAVSAQLGDLVESGMKRAAGVKDSGDLFPGHGGVLDRFDAFALATLVYLAVILGFSSWRR